jgi:hypothetical protein
MNSGRTGAGRPPKISPRARSRSAAEEWDPSFRLELARGAVAREGAPFIRHALLAESPHESGGAGVVLPESRVPEGKRRDLWATDSRPMGTIRPGGPK